MTDKKYTGVEIMFVINQYYPKVASGTGLDFAIVGRKSVKKRWDVILKWLK